MVFIFWIILSSFSFFVSTEAFCWNVDSPQNGVELKWFDQTTVEGRKLSKDSEIPKLQTIENLLARVIKNPSMNVAGKPLPENIQQRYNLFFSNPQLYYLQMPASVALPANFLEFVKYLTEFFEQELANHSTWKSNPAANCKITITDNMPTDSYQPFIELKQKPMEDKAVNFIVRPCYRMVIDALKVKNFSAEELAAMIVGFIFDLKQVTSWIDKYVSYYAKIAGASTLYKLYDLESHLNSFEYRTITRIAIHAMEGLFLYGYVPIDRINDAEFLKKYTFAKGDEDSFVNGKFDILKTYNKIFG